MTRASPRPSLPAETMAARASDEAAAAAANIMGMRAASILGQYGGPSVNTPPKKRIATAQTMTQRSRAQRCNFGNNLSIFDWLFGTAVLPDTLPEAFGLEDEAYPEGNIVRQFFYAFRPFPAERSLDSNASMPA
jgi:hypothetical protein